MLRREEIQNERISGRGCVVRFWSKEDVTDKRKEVFRSKS
jgi:hypothetical protein